jgi:hypothetical protein
MYISLSMVNRTNLPILFGDCPLLLESEWYLIMNTDLRLNGLLVRKGQLARS